MTRSEIMPAEHEMTVGEWTVDSERNELRRGPDVVHVEPKAIEVLRQLALRPGRVIGREELLSLLWPGVVVGDDALTQAIIKLRKALGDEAQSPRYIETIPKRGYRLVAPVSARGAESSAADATPQPQEKWTRGRRLFAAALASLVVVGIAGVALIVERSGTPWPLGTDAREHAAGSFPLVAVLPLANQSGDATREYLSDGMTADIIDALGRFSGVRVMSWNAVQAFKGKDASASAIREALRARYVVRGSVRAAGATVRVAIELSDAEKGVQLWSERYDGEGAQVFEIQDRIVRNVVGALAVKLTDIEQQRAFARPTDSAEAYDLVLRARALLRHDQRAANREARTLLARAQKVAPDYAEAWIAEGEAEWSRAAFGWIEDPEEGVARAEELARRALQSPDTRSHARAHSLIATLRTHTGHADEALLHTARAIAMNPSDTSALFRHGHALLAVGDADEAITTFENAMRYEPRPSIGPYAQLTTAYYVAGRYRDAVAYADLVISIRPDSFAIHALRAAALAQLGNLDEARRSAEMVRRLNPAYQSGGAGTRLLRPEQAARLRDGLAKAGL